jgi:hypothetical protein
LHPAIWPAAPSPETNIYRQVKDPNLVASLTGHAEGSRAFNRYREIDLGMKQDLVKILENKK